jgi:hypothetical protein
VPCTRDNCRPNPLLCRLSHFLSLLGSTAVLLGLGLYFSFPNPIHGRTPWTGDQPVARPLPTHRTTLTQNKRT